MNILRVIVLALLLQFEIRIRPILVRMDPYSRKVFESVKAGAVILAVVLAIMAIVELIQWLRG